MQKRLPQSLHVLENGRDAGRQAAAQPLGQSGGEVLGVPRERPAGGGGSTLEETLLEEALGVRGQGLVGHAGGTCRFSGHGDGGGVTWLRTRNEVESPG